MQQITYLTQNQNPIFGTLALALASSKPGREWILRDSSPCSAVKIHLSSLTDHAPFSLNLVVPHNNNLIHYYFVSPEKLKDFMQSYKGHCGVPHLIEKSDIVLSNYPNIEISLAQMYTRSYLVSLKLARWGKHIHKYPERPLQTIFQLVVITDMQKRNLQEMEGTVCLENGTVTK